MRGKVISTTSFLKKQRLQRLNDLQCDLKKLEFQHKNLQNPTTETEIKRKINQITEISNSEIKKKLIFTKQRYYEGGGKYAKSLAYKLRKQEADNRIHKILDSKTNNILSDTNGIKYCFKEYYEKLYS